MGKKEEAQKLLQEVTSVNPDRIESYMRIFDRMLLYTLATNLAPKEVLFQTLDFCDKVVRRGINIESQYRTNYLESTPQGRVSKLQNEPDGEELRLESLRTWNLAKRIIDANLSGFGPGENDEDESDVEFDY